MSHILKVSERISEETVDKFVSFLNQRQNIAQNSKSIIYFQSRGGLCSCVDVIQDLLSRHKDDVTLIGYGQLCSCAFDLFFLAACDTQLLPGTTGMMHQSSIEVEMNESFNPNYTEDKAKKRFMVGYMATQTLSIINYLDFNKKERDGIKKGNDVWFSQERMQEFYKIAISKRLQ